MGKVNEYASGRADGLQMALKLVEEGGIDALKQEIQFRNITGINTVMCKKEVEKATERIKEMTCDTIQSLMVPTIHDEFESGKTGEYREAVMLRTGVGCRRADKTRARGRAAKRE